MLEDESLNTYIASMNKIIASGNPKYLSYVCKEYMNSKKNNPVLNMILENMIKKEASTPNSIYAILIDKDNGINLDAMSDISKITNTADFIKNIDALADQDVDFGDLTSEELIIEGMQIAEELAKEIEEMENSIDYESDMQSENLESDINVKTENALGKITLFGAIAISFQKIIQNIKNRLSLTKSEAKEKIQSKRKMKKQEKKELEEKQKNESENFKAKLEKSNDFIQKVDIDEEAVIRKMQEGKNNNQKTKRHEINSTANVTDDDFNDTSDDDNNNNAQEDDEPDI